MEIDLTRCFDNGTFRFQQAFAEIFKAVPSEYTYSTNKVNYDLVDFFNNIKEKENCSFKIIKSTYISDIDTSASKSKLDDYEVWDQDSNRYIDKSSYLFTIDYLKREICRYGENFVTLYTDKHIDFNDWIKPVLESLKTKPEKIKPATIDLVAYDNGYYTINSNIQSTSFDFDNYNDDFQKALEETTAFLNQRESGLVIWHGIKGSGKTTAIRALISSVPKKYILVTNTIASYLAEPDFISFMHEHKDSVFILEDCEQILMNREENRFGGAIANILNMSDGLMSDIFNVKFLCTFNTDIDNIDDALLRPGRCYNKYEFKELCEEKTAKLLNKQGHTPKVVKPMTLANIYNYNPETEVETKKKIGF